MAGTDSNATLAKPQVEWRDVVGYEQFYEVSNDGRVRSLTRHVGVGKARRQIKGQPMKPSIDRKGYLKTELQRDGHRKHAFIHRLVVAMFIGPFTKGIFTNHKNGIKSDNRLANLEMVTMEENQRHAQETGLIGGGGGVGEDNVNAKLTDEIVKTIRRDYRRGGIGGPSGVALAKKYGVSQYVIHSVVTRKAWTHI